MSACVYLGSNDAKQMLVFTCRALYFACDSSSQKLFFVNIFRFLKTCLCFALSNKYTEQKKFKHEKEKTKMKMKSVNVLYVVFTLVKVALMALFVVFEAVPTFIDRLSEDRTMLFDIVEFIGSTASIYVVVTALVLVFISTFSLWGTFIAFVIMVFLMSLCTGNTAAIVLNIGFVIAFIPMLLYDLSNWIVEE